MAAAEQGYDERTGYYGSDIRTSCAMLAAHSIAAQVGYTGGPTRNDARAKRIAEGLVQAPAFKDAPPGTSTGTTNPRSSSQVHAPGWMGQVNGGGGQHVSIDPKVAEALSRAWLARDTLGLSADTAGLIVDRIQRTAEGVFYRYPNMRLNQANWYLELYVWAAVTADDPKRWAPEFQQQLDRWCAGAERVRSPWTIPNLSPSWSFHRDPLTGLDAAENIESNEYACIILDALSYLREAKANGVQLSAQQRKVLRAWSKRALSAYFTHSGYPNWDTGLYLERWHLGRYWAWALGGLFAIMLNDEQGDDADAATAKYLFDRAFATYTRWAEPAGPGGAADADLSRQEQAHAQPARHGRALRVPRDPRGLARHREAARRGTARDVRVRPVDRAPGDLHAPVQLRDRAADQRRVPVRGHRSVPPCRRRPARRGQHRRHGVGELRRDRDRGRPRRGGQRDAAHARRAAAVDDDQGAARPDHAGESYPASPYAGRFSSLEVTGTRSAGGVTVRATNNFTEARIVSTWVITRGSSAAALTVDAHFPSYGAGSIFAVSRGGRRTRLTPSGAGVRRPRSPTSTSSASSPRPAT